MKNLYFILTAFIYFSFSPNLLSQPYIEWVKNYGGSENEQANDIIETSDQGFIVAGYSASNDGDVGDNNGDRDFWVVKLTQSGDLDWENNYGGSEWDEARSIQETSNGGYIVGGFTISNDGDVEGNNGLWDAWILKLTQTGEIEWKKYLGGINEETANSIIETQDGGFVFVGNSASNDGDVSSNNGLHDFWIVKLSPDGDIVWEKNYGGSEKDFAFSIMETTDGAFIVTGVSESDDGDVSGNYGDQDVWVLKLNQLGELVWENNFGGSEQDRPNSIKETSDGGFIIAGYSRSIDNDIEANYGARDYWVLKLNQIGELEWENNFGGSLDDLGYSIYELSDQGFIVAGFSTSNNGDVGNDPGSTDSWIIKINESGVLEWEKAFGGTESDGIVTMYKTQDQGFVVAGFSESNDGDLEENNGSDDLWVMKMQLNPVSVEQRIFDSEVIISPNPSIGNFQISIESISIDYIEIFDIQGRSIYFNKNFDQNVQIENLNKGIYWIHFTSAKGRITKKIIIN